MAAPKGPARRRGKPAGVSAPERGGNGRAPTQARVPGVMATATSSTASVGELDEFEDFEDHASANGNRATEPNGESPSLGTVARAACAWTAALPERAWNLRKQVKQDVEGGADSLAYLFNLARGNRIRRRTAVPAAPQRRPILLIHGFMGTRGSMLLLERRLTSDGFVVFSFNIGAINTRDIRRSAYIIHRKIERILAQSEVPQLDILGHSMGGLIGLYYLKKLGGASRVRRLVMMGTPLGGTWIALAGIATLGLFSTSSWQLLPNSRFLRELAEGPIPPGVEVYSVGAVRDWVVPFASTTMDGTKSVPVPLGHSSLVISEAVYLRLKEILAAPDAPVIEDHPLGDAP